MCLTPKKRVEMNRGKEGARGVISVNELAPRPCGIKS